MTFNILWPGMRWDDDRQIETDSVADGAEAVFFDTEDDVPDDSYRRADAIVSVRDIPEHRWPLLERCRIFVTPKVGFDNIDIEGWGKIGMPVSNVPDYGTQEVADHALALLLSLVRCIPMHYRRLHQDPVTNWTPPDNPLARRMSRSVCGIVGLGRIGTAFALRAKTLGMDVVFYDPHKPNGSELALNVRRAWSLEELFAQSDVVSVHVPLAADTHNLINADVLAHAKQDMTFINSARGPIVDIDALYDAMRSGRVRAAGLDVLPEEPPSLDRPLVRAWANQEEWLLDRLLITPHSAFSTPESVYDMRFKPGQVALKYLSTGELDNCVNEQFLVDPR